MLPRGDIEPYETTYIFRQIAQEMYSNGSNQIEYCDQMKEFCKRDTWAGVKARQICPETCGCADLSVHIVQKSMMGCSPSCQNYYIIMANQEAELARDCE